MPWTKAARTEASSDGEPSCSRHGQPAEEALLHGPRRGRRQPGHGEIVR